MLVDLPINGVTRKALILTGKIGWGVVLDRQTGEFLQAFRTAYDNMVTGWTAAGRPIYDSTKVPKPEDVDGPKVFEICPHLHGARNVQAPSFSPVTGYYYLGVNNACMNAQVITPVFSQARGLTGVTYTTAPAPGYDHVGEFVAFDPVKRTRAWEYRPSSGAPMTASALATGGGIVFGGTADRQFFALHSETGELLWQLRLNGDISGAPITFEHDGKQYVVALSAGNALIGSAKGDSVWLFGLDGTLPPAAERDTESRTTAVPAAPAPGAAPAALALEGEEVFKAACVACHGEDGRGGHGGGAPLDQVTDAALVMTVITDGRGNMPPLGGALTPEQIRAVAAYVTNGLFE
jgi:alcohol dehydrogenase (cytochrome c)